MGGSSLFRKKGIVSSVSITQRRVTELEIETKTPSPIVNLSQELVFQFQATNFTNCNDQGDARIFSNSAPVLVDEDTNAAVKAYATFNDLGGNGPASPSPPLVVLPMFDNKGKTAWYQIDPAYTMAWDTRHPDVAHSQKFMATHCYKSCIAPTFITNANYTINSVYYDPHIDFNISASISVALWFYPTDISQIESEVFRFMLYRYIDASNYYMIAIKPTDQKVYVFVNEAAAITKLVSTGSVNVDAWNLIIFTYNPSTNALVIYLNGSSASSTPGDTPPTPWTGNSTLILGNIPGGLPTGGKKRFTGYLDDFVFWSGKILTSTEAGNMWTRGTII
jgi:hypothetical protein